MRLDDQHCAAGSCSAAGGVAGGAGEREGLLMETDAEDNSKRAEKEGEGKGGGRGARDLG